MAAHGLTVLASRPATKRLLAGETASDGIDGEATATSTSTPSLSPRSSPFDCHPLNGHDSSLPTSPTDDGQELPGDARSPTADAAFHHHASISSRPTWSFNNTSDSYHRSKRAEDASKMAWTSDDRLQHHHQQQGHGLRPYYPYQAVSDQQQRHSNAYLSLDSHQTAALINDRTNIVMRNDGRPPFLSQHQRGSLDSGRKMRSSLTSSAPANLLHHRRRISTPGQVASPSAPRDPAAELARMRLPPLATTGLIGQHPGGAYSAIPLRHSASGILRQPNFGTKDPFISPTWSRTRAHESISPGSTTPGYSPTSSFSSAGGYPFPSMRLHLPPISDDQDGYETVRSVGGGAGSPTTPRDPSRWTTRDSSLSNSVSSPSAITSLSSRVGSIKTLDLEDETSDTRVEGMQISRDDAQPFGVGRRSPPERPLTLPPIQSAEFAVASFLGARMRCRPSPSSSEDQGWTKLPSLAELSLSLPLENGLRGS